MSTKLHNFGYEQLAAIIDVLGDPDTLKILDKATAGFESGKVTIKELKMTTRKYYRSLKELNDADLVMRFENKYKLTAQGEFIHNRRRGMAGRRSSANQRNGGEHEQPSRRRAGRGAA